MSQAVPVNCGARAEPNLCKSFGVQKTTFSVFRNSLLEHGMESVLVTKHWRGGALYISVYHNYALPEVKGTLYVSIRKYSIPDSLPSTR